LASVIILGALTYISYIYSKQAAIELVGKTIQYLPLKTVKLTKAPFDRKYPVWRFKFSCIGAFDEEFEIYTTVQGNIEVTNPRNLQSLLRKFENMEVHPYSGCGS